MTPQTVTFWVGASTASAALLGLAGKTLRGTFRMMRKIGRLIDDVTGYPARDDVPARASLMTRIGALEDKVGLVIGRVAELEKQFRPNGGSSVADAISRIAVTVGTEPIPSVPPVSPGTGDVTSGDATGSEQRGGTA